MIGKSIGRYILSGEVGFGGMGAVYQATDIESGQVIAVKLLSHEYINDLGLRSAFEREAQLVFSLVHEAIVPVYEFGHEGGQPYLVMPYMPNGSLADRLLQSVFSPEEFVPILNRICQAIDYAHSQGIIHRDLKPSNILFDENDQAYLADFGIAWQLTSHQASSPIKGTPAYLSPEQALGDEEVDGRCDIYALGIIVFESLTGELPFDGQIPLAVILKQIHDQAPSLRSANWNLPAALDEVVQQALAKDPADRFSTAGELASAYRLALSGETMGSQPSPDSGQRANQSQERLSGMPDAGMPDAGMPDAGMPDAGMPDGVESRESSANPQPVEKKTSGHPDTERIDIPVPWQAPTQGGWRLPHLIALGLATFMGLLFATGLTAFLRLPQRETLLSDSFVGAHLSFDRTSLVLINRSQEPLDLSGLSFRRIAAGDASPAEFQASRWIEAGAAGQPALPPGGCYQLLLPTAASFSLRPGRPLPTIPGCTGLQGWLIVPDPQSWFWVSEGDSNSFVVVWKGTDVQTCSIEAGSCQFRLEAP